MTEPTRALAPKTGKIDLKILDGFRGMAALYVMIGHARWLLWEGFSGYANHPAAYSLPEKALVYFFSVFRFGHEAVLFFFVLSGFVIHLRYARLISRGDYVPFDAGDYFKRRARRIYPPFLFVLLFTFLLDGLGRYLGYSIYFHATPNKLINTTIPFDHSIINLLGNLIFWQNDYITVWGSDTPLWSLKFEWWFYMIYPLMLLLNRKSISAAFGLVCVLFISSFFLHWAPATFF
ncbi:MAG: acyltransferase, partial [Bacteroidetes bacterium]|nr:acyltransferase [Bacteroidota bacterium]